MSAPQTNDRIVAAAMARLVMAIMSIGSGVGLILLLMQSSAAVPVCIGTGALTVIVLAVGGYFVARAKNR